MQCLVRAAAIFLAVVLGSGAALAQDAGDSRAVVLELFTSQGCSSCPPADEMLTMLSKRDDVIALGLHVDYWDYIGWKDRFAQAKFTKRQRAYAGVAGSRMIYTPQMVIGGTDHVIGTRPMEVSMALDKHRNRPEVVTLRLIRDGGRARITAQTPTVATGELLVQLVEVLPEHVETITRGENRGRTITYSNIATSWTEIARWSATSALDLMVDMPSSGHIAVILQRPGPGPIVAARILR